MVVWCEALSLHSKMVPGSNPVLSVWSKMVPGSNSGLSMWSLHVLSRYSGFLPPSKNMHVSECEHVGLFVLFVSV